MKTPFVTSDDFTKAASDYAEEILLALQAEKPMNPVTVNVGLHAGAVILLTRILETLAVIDETTQLLLKRGPTSTSAVIESALLEDALTPETPEAIAVKTHLARHV